MTDAPDRYMGLNHMCFYNLRDNLQRYEGLEATVCRPKCVPEAWAVLAGTVSRGEGGLERGQEG